MEYNHDTELYDWLLANSTVKAQTKIDKIRSAQGKGNSFSLLDFFGEDKDNPLVNIEIGVDDYEDENNVEGVWFHVLVDGHHEDTFANLSDAHAYYQKRIKEELAKEKKED